MINYFDCGEHGHFMRNCYMFKRGKKHESSTNIVNENNSDDNDSNIIRKVLFMSLDNIKNS